MSSNLQQCLDRGIDLFNRQEFYEAHEAWEEAWQEETGDARRLLQGLIQIAAGFYKLQTGAPVGTVKLLSVGVEKVRAYLGGPLTLGLDLHGLVERSQAWIARAQALVEEGRTDYDPAQLPTISLQGPRHMQA